MNSFDNRLAADRILDGNGLALHGYCGFELLSDRLISCRAADRMRAAFSDSPPKTVIVALFPYRADDREGNLSRYARLPDYHAAAGGVLESAAASLSAALSDYRFLAFIDNSPIPEVRAAALAGLGRVGDHHLLINPVFGSWVFIGCIVTDMPVEFGEQSIEGCLQCGKCAAGCPSGCAGGESRQDCVSRLTQLKGELDPRQRELLKKSGMAWGCDRCQEVCPLNSGVRTEPHACFGGKVFEPSLTEDIISDLEDRAYGWRGAEVLKRNLEILYSK
ncbi:MAG: epoxyqueuosine reductase [Clostridiales bacterium]|jgi:epoxyqueuosine reductase|nr:epoxyqueuosine reductase [Clostridiales bacterium]